MSSILCIYHSIGEDLLLLNLRNSHSSPTKRRYKHSKKLDLPTKETDLAYLAGLIDGDGCITRFNPSRGYWNIKIYMTDKEVIDWLTATLGVTVSSHLRKDRTRRMYMWHLSRQANVRLFLLAVSPYLRVHAKRRKAIEAITEIEWNAWAKTSDGATLQLF
jgi:hypothetical protein